jgi:hypothetical protein
MRQVADALASGSLPRTVERPRPVPEPPELPLRWLEAGSVGRWMPVYTRPHRKIELREARYRIALTEVSDPPSSAAAQQWLSAQQALAPDAAPALAVDDDPEEGPSDETARPAVFWRIAINRGVCALGAAPAPSVDVALSAARSVVARASRLTVVLAFSEGQPRPHWVVRDGDTTVLVGLPDFHLAVTSDSQHSLGAILAEAQFQGYIHHTGGLAD